jgi:hypothetical protein
MGQSSVISRQFSVAFPITVRVVSHQSSVVRSHQQSDCRPTTVDYLLLVSFPHNA